MSVPPVREARGRTAHVVRDLGAGDPGVVPSGDGPHAPAGPRPTGRRGGRSGSRWTALLFMAPLLAYLVAFYAYPLYRNVDLSLHDYTIRAFVTGDAEFVGLQNHVDVVTSRLFDQAVFNTVVFTGVSLVFQYALGLALAVFFRRHFPLSMWLRALFLVPWLLPLIVSASAWAWMLNSENGVVNAFLALFGVDQVNWLTSPGWALASVTIANIWLGIPFNLVILYAGLQNIPGELYEAAALDGAGGWKQFTRITFPLLVPVSTVTLLLGLIYTLKVVDIIWVMTSGGPAGASTTLAVWSYREAFGTGRPDFSPAAAVGNLLILVALAGGFLYLWLQRRQARS
ncbi:carbohydrate ABC transporter permease [Aquipuribacter sp. SD81]|uniref:carbohydrate ABC transporter permease n=1 Tax=Aquipuribacter sp. SD81 TaxID=3127703 RepID=UPI003018443C